jgi:thioredoxin-related protein
VVVVPSAADPQDAIDWLTDYEEACKVAAEEKRALLILISTDDLERTSQSCRFAGDVIRRTVRDAKVVPLKLLPAPALDLAGLRPEEAKKRQEVLTESRKRYEELAKRFGVTTVPSVVYAAPDGAKLTVQAAPSDEDIRGVLVRLPEMVKAQADAVAREGKKPEPLAVKDDPGKQPEPKKPEPPKDTKDDF